MRSQVIKFRVSKRTKENAVAVAERSHTAISALMRDLLLQVGTGRSHNDAVRADMAVVRQLANTVLSEAEGTRRPEVMADAGRRLREVAARHLGPVS